MVDDMVAHRRSNSIHCPVFLTRVVASGLHRISYSGIDTHASRALPRRSLPVPILLVKGG